MTIWEVYTKNMTSEIIKKCRTLLRAYEKGLLGDQNMPEDCHPVFKTKEEKLTYFTLPMALNYQRDSYKLWQAAKKTFEDKETRDVYNLRNVARMDESVLREKLLKHKLALQPVKHIQTWHKISKTIFENWETLNNFFETNKNDFLLIKNATQLAYKKAFPYLSGPKIFNYWSFIISTYGGVSLSNKEFIEIAPDTHITKCSVKLGVTTQEESNTLSKDQVSERWRKILSGSGILPIEMHPPLWFWGRNGFKFKI